MPTHQDPSLHRSSFKGACPSQCATPSRRLRATPDGPSSELDMLFGTLSALVAPDAAVVAGLTPLGRGLVACTALPPGSLLLQVDRFNCLAVSDDPGGPGGAAFGRSALAEWQAVHGALPPLLNSYILSSGTDWFLRMCAWLLHLASAGPGLWPLYTQILPKESEMSCLMNYRPEERGELQSPALEATAAAERAAILGLHDRIFGPGGDLKRLRLAAVAEDTLWAACMVNSRSFSDTVGGGESVSFMVPCADMANHYAPPNAGYAYNAQAGAFELRARSALSPGQEACISYGCVRKTNAQLMKDYGFVIEGNPNDRVPFAAGDDVLSTLRAAQGTAPPRPSLHRALLAASMEAASAAAAAAPWGPEAGRRAAALASLQPFLREAPGLQLGEAAAAAERQAVAALRGQIAELLAAHATTAETDEGLLVPGGGGRGLSPRHRAAVASRLERKRLLAATDEVMQQYAASLA